MGKFHIAYRYCGILFFLLPLLAHGGINLNLKWTELENGLFDLSITPTGTFDVPSHMTDMRCNVQDPGWPCIGNWQIIVGNNPAVGCEPFVSSPSGTYLTTHAASMSRAYNGKTCTAKNLTINGTEKICIKNSTDGKWLGSMVSSPGMNLYATSGCWAGSEGGGGTIDPPVSPASCYMDNVISLAHGSIDYSSIEGSEANYKATVSCTRQSTVRITIPNGGKVNLNNDGSFYSIISIMGAPGQYQFVNSGSAAITFTSQLHHIGTGRINGAFSNSTVAVLDIL